MPIPFISPNRRILVVDDNFAIHTDFRKILDLIGSTDRDFDLAEAALFDDPAVPSSVPEFELECASQGEEAYHMAAAAAAAGRPYAVAFVDMRMPPGWDGVQTTMKLWEICPDLQVVICTAYSDRSWDEMVEQFGQTDRLLVLKKPFDNIEVLQLAHALTEKWRLLQQANTKTEELERCVAERTRELQAEMAARSAVEETLRQAQKMQAVGQLAAGVAHDFNNLLSVIRSYSGLLLGKKTLDAGSLEAVSQIDSAAERAANLTRQLLTFSRRQIIQPEHLDLSDVARQVGKLLQRLLGEVIALRIESALDLPSVFADRGMIEQIILNLAVNARDAMPAGGPLLIRTSAAHFTEDRGQIRAGHFACLTVSDHGCGIPPEILPRLFEPFFTTKEVGKGTGLGLATVYGIVRQHGGWVEVESEAGHGATFRIFLPEAVQPRSDTPPKVTSAPSTKGDETIFLVEDDAALREVNRLILEEDGYRVYVADSGVAALRDWPRYADSTDLLLTDMVMPGGVSGRELAKKLQAAKPSLKVIHTSGYSLELSGADGVLEEGLTFLPKPYTCEKLTTTVRNTLDQAGPARNRTPGA